MADIKISTFSRISYVAEFTDGDTRTITLDNCKSAITAEMIQAVQTAAADVLIGDKAGAPFSRITEVNKQNGTTTTMDFA